MLAAFVLVYFAIPFFLHAAMKTPRPVTIAQTLEPARYYPNAFAVTYDLIGTPVLLLLLTLLPSFIERQCRKLGEDGVVASVPARSRAIRLLLRPWLQVTLIGVVPLLWGVAGLVQDVRNYPQEDVVAYYKLALAVLSRYARASGVIQVALVLIAVRRLVIAPRVVSQHPDGCSGLAPFGNLALATYAVLFVNTLMVAVGVAVGGVSLVDTMGLSRTVAQAIVWLAFPFVALYIFESLILRPHIALQWFLRDQVSAAAVAWQIQQKDLTDRLAGGAGKADDFGRLKSWAELNETVAATHTWPVSRGLLRNVAVLVSPIIPPLVTIIRNYLQA